MKISTCILFLFTFTLFPGFSFSQEEDSFSSIQEKIREIVEEKLKISPEQFSKLQKGTNIPSVGQSEKRSSLMSGEQKITSDPLPESEVHAVINPKDSNNLVFSPIRYQNLGGSYTLICPVIYTKDFGQSWHESNFKTGPSDMDSATIIGGGDPVLAFDSNGKLYFSWINLYIHGTTWDTVWWAMYWAYSDDGGENWSRAADDKIGICRGKIISSQFSFDEVYDKQWMAVDLSNSAYKNSLYVAYLMASTTSASEGIYVSRKRAASQNFEYSKILVSGSLEGIQFSNIVVDDSGYVHVLFCSTTDKTNYSIWHVLSTDGGQSFSNPVKICNMIKPATIKGIQSNRIYPAPQLAVDHSDSATKNNLYLTFTAIGISSDKHRGADVYFCRSTDNGLNWSAPVTIDDDTSTSAKDQFYSSLAVNSKGQIAVSWYDGRYSTVNTKNDYIRYFMAFSLNGGKSFTKNISVSTAASDFRLVGWRNNSFGVGEYNQVVTTPSAAIPFWSDGRDSNGNLNIYAAYIPFSANPSGIFEISAITAGISISPVYPQPVKDIASIDVETKVPSTIKISILDLNSRLIAPSQNRLTFSGKNTISLPTSQLKAGTYILLLETQYGYFTRKILKIN